MSVKINTKIIVQTPKGKIIRYKTGDTTFEAKLEWNPKFGDEMTNDFNEVQKFVDSEVLRYSSAYVPFVSGALQKSGILGTDIGSGFVEWIAPYAKYQYYSTAKTRDYDSSGKRGGVWFERMKIDHREEIIDGAKKVMRQRRK